MNSLTKETFNSDFIKLFIKLKILLYFSINRIDKHKYNIDSIVESYINILDLENKKFEPYLIENFKSLDNFINTGIRKKIIGNNILISFNDTFYITAVLYVINNINNIIKVIKGFENLKIKFLKLRNSLTKIELNSKLKVQIIINSIFSNDDRYYINFIDKHSNTSTHQNIVNQLNFINNIIQQEFKNFSKFNFTNILFFINTLYNTYIKTDDIFISFFYIFKYLNVSFNLFLLLNQLK